jgi:hypothetical protein
MVKGEYKTIDWKMVEGLCRLHCTEVEIAGLCKINIDTLADAIKREHNQTFSEYFAEKSAAGKMSLRRSQWKVACETENPTMLIWLGKQHLGQTNKENVAIEAKVENTIRFTRASD